MPYRLKPEYKKMLETYPSFEEEVNLQKGGVKVEGEFILVHNIITGHNDRLWICLSMFDASYKYKAKDKLISLLCAKDTDFNNTFQCACTAQWDDPSCYVRITYPLSDLDREMDSGSKIHVYKGDIERIVV